MTEQGRFAEIVGAHQSMVFGLAYNFLRDEAAAEDLAQDVFLELHRNFAKLSGDRHIVYWLRKVTSRRCIDHVRKRKFRRTEPLQDCDEPGAPPILSDPFLSEKLAQHIARLAETPRIVLVLRYQEELEPGEIAELLEMPVNTVKSHLQRALTSLRERFERTKAKVVS